MRLLKRSRAMAYLLLDRHQFRSEELRKISEEDCEKKLITQESSGDPAAQYGRAVPFPLSMRLLTFRMSRECLDVAVQEEAQRIYQAAPGPLRVQHEKKDIVCLEQPDLEDIQRCFAKRCPQW
ncbi:unnamed protein product [Gongylonema pulchrum]|uniref:ADF-H domain-containing protein n=1 Tax=Gongylonema pulchrum TaxID=637853 RepID=A0A183DM98_9BILA|nr:unnamed protein product [Gongylonema pulchrum]